MQILGTWLMNEAPHSTRDADACHEWEGWERLLPAMVARCCDTIEPAEENDLQTRNMSSWSLCRKGPTVFDSLPNYLDFVLCMLSIQSEVRLP